MAKVWRFSVRLLFRGAQQYPTRLPRYLNLVSKTNTSPWFAFPAETKINSRPSQFGCLTCSCNNIHTSRNLHDKHQDLPEISEDDLNETFTSGHGPGGQSVNKSTNCCVLRHVPTGVAVKVHETRSLDQNRKLARLRLRQKLDQFLNKENSVRERERREASITRKLKKKKTNERLEKLKAFKEREGLS